MDNASCSATITEITLFDLFQLMLMVKDLKTIEIQSGKNLGVIQFSSGRITFAKSSSGALGIDAFYQILSWEEGDCNELELSKPLKTNIEDRGNLLLEAFQHLNQD